MLHYNNTLCFIAFYLFSLLPSQAQSLKYSLWFNAEFLNEDGETLHNALSGGINQAQFSMADLNNDGKKDLVLFDRSGNKYSTFINESTGAKPIFRYHPQYEGQFPITNDWALMADYNNDGKEDLYTYGGNVNVRLYRNATKSGDTSIQFEKKMFPDEGNEPTPYLTAFTYSQYPQFDTSEVIADFNNLPAIADVDGDGDMDYLTLLNGGFGISFYRNNSVEEKRDIEDLFFLDIDWCWGDFEEGQNSNDIFLRRPEYCLRKYYKKHPSGSTLSVFDNDDDGDVDLLLGNAGYDNLIFLENGRAQHGTVQDSMIAFDAFFPSGTLRASLPSFPSSFLVDIDQDGARDLIVSVNNTDKSSYVFLEDDHVYYYRNEGEDKRPDFKIVQKDFLVGDMIDHGGWAAPALADIDNDGDYDLFIGHNGNYAYTLDQSDRIAYYENIGNATNAVFQLRDTNYLNISAKSLKRIAPHLADVDGDDDLDLLLGLQEGQIALYRNEGTANNASFVFETDFWKGLDVGEAATISTADVNGDGELDLILGESNGNFNYYRGLGGERYVQENDTFGNVLVNDFIVQTKTNPVTLEPYDTLIMESQGYSAPVFTDLDGNGKPEIISGSLRGYLKLYYDISLNAQDTFKEQEGFVYDFREQNYAYYKFGFETMPAAADLDGDGNQEIVVGNRRGGISIISSKGLVGNTKTIRNPLHQLKLYPNPANGLFFLEAPAGTYTIEITDLNGRVIKTNQIRHNLNDRMEIELREQADGVYFIHLMNSQGYHKGLKAIKLGNH